MLLFWIIQVLELKFKIKYQLLPVLYNPTGIDQSNTNTKHVTYNIPQTSVLNAAHSILNTYNTSTAKSGNFFYKLITPQDTVINTDLEPLSDKDKEQLNDIIKDIENGPTSNPVGTKVPAGFYTTSFQALPPTLIK